MSRRVLVGAVLHMTERSHRMACFEPWLAHLAALETRDLDVRYCFVLDGLGAGCERRVRNLLWATFPTPTLIAVDSPDLRMSEQRRARRSGGPMFRHMAFVRNLLRERALDEQVDFLFSVDGDIVVHAGLLQRLVGEDRAWVSALIPNTEPPDVPYAWNILDFSEDRIRAFHIEPSGAAADFGGPCDVTGAVCLYRRDVLRAARWENDPQGEDVGFGRLASAAHLRAWFLPLVAGATHLVTDQVRGEHIRTCPTCLPVLRKAEEDEALEKLAGDESGPS